MTNINADIPLSPDELWEHGIEHHPESYKFIKLINTISPDLELSLGGDGDIGEQIAFVIDYLINTRQVKLEIL
jgi:hypothetical protein